MRMGRRLSILLSGAALLFGHRAFAADPQAFDAFQKNVRPVLEQYCYPCHGNGKHEADLSLDSFKTMEDIENGGEKWQLVLEVLKKGEMPPEDAKAKPTQAQKEQITDWIQNKLFQYDPKNPDPGRVTIRRLNRAEYNNTIRDLVGVDFQPAEDFPSDDSGYGFDNIGDVLSLPPVLMEKYLAAANRIFDEAIVTETIPSRVRKYKANLMEMGFNAVGDRGDGWMPLAALEEDCLATAIPVPAGDYIVRVYAYARGRGNGGGAPGGRGGRAGGAAPAAQGANGAAVEEVAEAAEPPPAPVVAGNAEPVLLSLQLDDTIMLDWKVTATEAAPQMYEARIGVSAGRHRFKVLNRRIRGGENEFLMKNGRIGREQTSALMVKSVEIEGPIPSDVRRFPASKLETSGDIKLLSNGSRLLDHNGEVGAKFNVPSEGDYLLRVQAYADQAGTDFAKMEMRLDGKVLRTIDVSAPGQMIPLDGQRVFSMELLNPMPYVYEVRTHLKPGDARFSAAFINDHTDAKNENPNLRDRNLYVQYLEVVNLSGKQSLPPMPAPLAKYFQGKTVTAQNKQSVAKQILSEFTQRAWRRPVQDAEVTGLLSLFNLADKDNEPFEAAMKLPLKAVLISPNFLFRGEVQPDPDNPKSVHPVDEYALASRLSYFLWSSLPDDELFNLAERKQLRNNLESQVRRMLASPKAQALVDNFSGQWLQTRNLKFVAPDKDLFPDYDLSLGAAMATETQKFFEYVLREDRSVIDFLNGDYTFVNDRLSDFYGLTPVKGSDFQKVSLKGTPRAGVLTQGSVLTITSNPTRTSPVKRGKWVLDNLLGTPPPPPPPDVPELPGDGKPTTGSLRQQMEKHREIPSCASCHARMDPIGFGLENFDGIGKMREKDGEFPIVSAGELVTGESFKSAAELANILATRKRAEFLRCISDKMLTYAMGRGTEYYDRPAVDQIIAGMEAKDAKFSALIMEVVKSAPFQMRRGDRQATVSANQDLR